MERQLSWDGLKTEKLAWVFGLLFFLLSSPAFAGSGITYHGKIIKPDGVTPVTSPTTQFRIQIRTPGTENCLLWEEQQTKDLSTSAGVFTITIADTNESTLIPNTLPFTLDRVFSNRTNFTSLTNCSVGSAYNPTTSDGRSLQVSFRENPGDPWELLPATKINFVPLALNSVQLEGYQANEFLKIDPASSYTALTSTQVNTLMDIIAGTNTQYLRPATTFSGDVSGTYNATSVDKLKGVSVSTTAPTNGQVLKYNGTTWAPAADDTGSTVSDASYTVKGIVQINTDLATSGLFISNGVLALPNVITAGGPTGGASTVPIITYDQKGRLTAVTTATVNDTTKLPLAGGTMTGNINMGGGNVTNATSITATNVGTRNLILSDNDTNTITLKTPSDISGNVTLTLPSDGGTSGKLLSTDGAGTLSWVSPNSGLSLTANKSVVANGTGTALTTFSCSLNQVFSFDASGNPTCANVTASGGFLNGGNSFGANATLGTNDNYSLGFKTNNSTQMTLDTSGRLGIGTNSPTDLLTLYKVYNPSLKIDNAGLNSFQATIGSSGIYLGTNGDNGTTNADLVLAADNTGTGHTARVTINATSGYVGVGTGSPSTILDVNGALTQRGMAAPSLSPAGQGRIYFDSTSNTFKVSQNGGAYADIITSASVSGNYVAKSGDTMTGPLVNNSNSASSALAVTQAGSGSAATFTGGYVGIGTTSPTAQLDVSGSIIGDVKEHIINTYTGSQGATAGLEIRTHSDAGSYIDFTPSSTSDAGSGSPDYGGRIIYNKTVANGFGFTTNGSTAYRMVIDSSGNVGIGTSTPAAFFDVSPPDSTTGNGQGIRIVAQNAKSSGVTSYNGGSVYIKGGRGNVYGTNNDVTISGGDSSSGGSGATLVLGGAPYQTAGTATLTGGGGWNGQGNVTIQGGSTTPTGFVLLQPSGGYVGVGTSSPSSILDVNGALTQRGMAAPSVSPAGQGRIYFDSTAKTFKVSQDGAAYSDLVTTSSLSSSYVAKSGDTMTGWLGVPAITATDGSGATISLGLYGANTVSLMTNTNNPTSLLFRSSGGWNAALLQATKVAGTNDNGTLVLKTTGHSVNQVYLDEVGNVGIGTNAPSSTLTVNGALTAQGMTAPSVSPAGQGRIYFDSTSKTFKISQDGSSYSDLVTNASTGFLTTAAYNSDVTPAASCTTSQTPYWNTISDTWACQNINVTTAGGFFKDGGNSLGAAASLGTNDANSLSLKTNNSSRLTIKSTGEVGIGTTNPSTALQVTGSAVVSGQIATGSQTITGGGSSTIDWSNGNAISTDFDCGSSITFNDLRDGGTYTLAITGAGTTQCSFSTTTTGAGAGTVSYRFNPANGTRTASSHTIYTLMRIGSVVYVSWQSGF